MNKIKWLPELQIDGSSGLKILKLLKIYTFFSQPNIWCGHSKETSLTKTNVRNYLQLYAHNFCFLSLWWWSLNNIKVKIDLTQENCSNSSLWWTKKMATKATNRQILRPNNSEMIIYFLISQPKHMLWVLKRTVSMRINFGVQWLSGRALD